MIMCWVMWNSLKCDHNCKVSLVVFTVVVVVIVVYLELILTIFFSLPLKVYILNSLFVKFNFKFTSTLLSLIK